MLQEGQWEALGIPKFLPFIDGNACDRKGLDSSLAGASCVKRQTELERREQAATTKAVNNSER